ILYFSLFCISVSVYVLHSVTKSSFSLPDPLSAPKVHCWCSSYPNATLCTWPKPPHFPTTHYIATYSERHNQASTKECHLLPPGSSSSEKFWICQLPNLKLLTDYIINITAVHSGRSSSHLTSFMLEDIVKPDPPVDVRVSPTNNRKLLVEWSPPPTWTNLAIFPLKYQIIYQWENKGIRRSVNVSMIFITPYLHKSVATTSFVSSTSHLTLTRISHVQVQNYPSFFEATSNCFFLYLLFS
uniref:Fibronectin type-III domain-containing protein n=1 Tax=Astatotilapia calliptera TaxID=8154 RepID=A0A3P8PEQ6_ASTCA